MAELHTAADCIPGEEGGLRTVADSKPEGGRLGWLEGAVRSKEVFAQKLQLYSAILNRPTALTR